MGRIVELVIALDVERQLKVLRASSPTLDELPIRPLLGVDDLVRLEIALRRFSEIHRSKRSKALIRAVRRTLDAARARLRERAAADSLRLPTQRGPVRDIQPAARSGLDSVASMAPAPRPPTPVGEHDHETEPLAPRV
jgi:hypothetical protein